MNFIFADGGGLFPRLRVGGGWVGGGEWMGGGRLRWWPDGEGGGGGGSAAAVAAGRRCEDRHDCMISRQQSAASTPHSQETQSQISCVC